MSHIDTTVKFFEAMQSLDWQTLMNVTTEDFLYHGPMPDPLNREIWRDFHTAVLRAFPDWKYELTGVEDLDSERVKVTVNITGTHTQDLELPLHSLPKIPASGTKINLPDEHATLTFRNGKVHEMRVDQSPHGGVVGLLEQLRIE